MPDWLSGVLATPGLGLIAAAALAAGMVRGFSGFGTAMVFLPLAGQVVPPVTAVAILVVMDAFGPLPNLPRAWRDGQPADVGRLLAGTVVTLPLGLMALGIMAPEAFRAVVGTVALAMVAALICGLRYRGRLVPPMVYGIGSAAGFLGGVAGVPGPPVILFYMASPLPAAAVRGNTMLYLFAFDLLILSALGLRGDLTLHAVGVGLAMAGPVVLGNVLGAAMCRPGKEGLYRGLAYAIIVGSAISGLAASL